MVEDESPTPFEQRLVTRAKQIADGLEGKLWNTSAPSIIEREIALTLRKIDRLHALHETLKRSLLTFEYYVHKEYATLNRRLGYKARDIFFEQGNLKWKLLEIGKERRRLTLVEEQELQGLHDQLLSLVNKHRQLAL